MRISKDLVLMNIRITLLVESKETKYAMHSIETWKINLGVL